MRNSLSCNQILFAVAENKWHGLLDAPQELDAIQNIDGIKVAIGPQIASTGEFTLDKEENQVGVGLFLIGGSNCC